MRRFIVSTTLSVAALATCSPATAQDYISSLFQAPSQVSAPAPVPRALVLSTRQAHQLPAITVQRVEVRRSPMIASQEFYAKAPQRDPWAFSLFMSESPYLPPQASCQEIAFDRPTCSYQRPYVVFDLVHGGGFDISPDYMKNIDPRYNAALLNAGG